MLVDCRVETIDFELTNTLGHTQSRTPVGLPHAKICDHDFMITMMQTHKHMWHMLSINTHNKQKWKKTCYIKQKKLCNIKYNIWYQTNVLTSNVKHRNIGICKEKLCNIKQCSTQGLIDCIHRRAVEITREMLERNNKHPGYHVIWNNENNIKYINNNISKE